MPDPKKSLKAAAALFQTGRHREALEACRPLFHGPLEIAGAAHQLSGLILNANGNVDAATIHLRRAVIVAPSSRAPWVNLTVVERRSAERAPAFRRHRLLCVIGPTQAESWHALALHANDEGRMNTARRAGRRALLLSPGTAAFLESYAELSGTSARETEDFLRRACAADPGAIATAEKAVRHFGARNDHATALKLLTRALRARESPRLRTLVGFTLAGFTLRGLWRNDEATDHFRRALVLAPETGEALLGLMWCRRQACDWDGDLVWLSRAHGVLLAAGLADPQPAFTLAWSDDPAVQLRAARAIAQAHLKATRPPGRDASGMSGAGKRIRLGYLSPHFGEHPVGRCIVEVLERHDRARFEVFAYASKDHGAHEIYRRVAACVEHFRPLGAASEDEISARIRSDEIDILVDLDGYAQGHPNIIAHRPAPVLVNFLGYPGTGGGLHDYLINDRNTIRPGTETAYTEPIVWMPDCYLPPPTEGRPAPTPTRADEGLPSGRLVLAAFHTAYKITPEAFGAWCRILRAVPDAVLWLPGGPASRAEALRAAAERRGVAPDRLIFARFHPEHGDHLARLPLADLYLDTFPHTSHSTAAELMYRACPLVTRTGDAFASRVAASVLGAAGMLDLVTPDWEAFIAKAITLCTTPGALGRIRQRLRAARTSAPLFDRDRYVRALETGFAEMAERHRAGKPPAPIRIAA